MTTPTLYRNDQPHPEIRASRKRPKTLLNPMPMKPTVAAPLVDWKGFESPSTSRSPTALCPSCLEGQAVSVVGTLERNGSGTSIQRVLQEFRRRRSSCARRSTQAHAAHGGRQAYRIRPCCAEPMTRRTSVALLQSIACSGFRLPSISRDRRRSRRDHVGSVRACSS